MSLQAELDHEEQSLLEFPEVRSERAWSRSHIGNEALSADAGTEFVRARMPATQPQPTGKPRIVDSPDDHPDQDEGRESRHAGFLRRRPLALALALPWSWRRQQAAIFTGITRAASNRPMMPSSQRATFPWRLRSPATSLRCRSPITSMSPQAM